MPIDFVVGGQMTVRRFPAPATFNVDLVGQKSDNPNGGGDKITNAVRREALKVAPVDVHIVRIARYIRSILIGVERNGRRVCRVAGRSGFLPETGRCARSMREAWA